MTLILIAHYCSQDCAPIVKTAAASDGFIDQQRRQRGGMIGVVYIFRMLKKTLKHYIT